MGKNSNLVFFLWKKYHFEKLTRKLVEGITVEMVEVHEKSLLKKKDFIVQGTNHPAIFDDPFPRKRYIWNIGDVADFDDGRMLKDFFVKFLDFS